MRYELNHERQQIWERWQQTHAKMIAHDARSWAGLPLTAESERVGSKAAYLLRAACDGLQPSNHWTLNETAFLKLIAMLFENEAGALWIWSTRNSLSWRGAEFSPVRFARRGTDVTYTSSFVSRSCASLSLSFVRPPAVVLSTDWLCVECKTYEIPFSKLKWFMTIAVPLLGILRVRLVSHSCSCCCQFDPTLLCYPPIVKKEKVIVFAFDTSCSTTVTWVLRTFFAIKSQIRFFNVFVIACLFREVLSPIVYCFYVPIITVYSFNVVSVACFVHARTTRWELTSMHTAVLSSASAVILNIAAISPAL